MSKYSTTELMYFPVERVRYGYITFPGAFPTVATAVPRLDGCSLGNAERIQFFPLFPLWQNPGECAARIGSIQSPLGDRSLCIWITM